MKFLLLLYMEDHVVGSLPPHEKRELDLGSARYDDELKRRGHLIVAEALQGVEAATCVRRSGGKVSTTDGPFVETKEHLGGFLLIEARDREEALRIASTDPMLDLGAIIEVRPIHDYRAELGVPRAKR